MAIPLTWADILLLDQSLRCLTLEGREQLAGTLLRWFVAALLLMTTVASAMYMI